SAIRQRLVALSSRNKQANPMVARRFAKDLGLPRTKARNLASAARCLAIDSTRGDARRFTRVIVFKLGLTRLTLARRSLGGNMRTLDGWSFRIASATSLLIG